MNSNMRQNKIEIVEINSIFLHLVFLFWNIFVFIIIIYLSALKKKRRHFFLQK